MQKEVLRLKFVNVKDNFLHFSPSTHKNFTSPGICCLKGILKENTYYFSSSPLPQYGLQNDSVGISSAYARSLGLSENDVLVILPVYNLGSIKRIFVSPASEDDYAILLESSSAVESNLLNQLRIVWVQQKFCAWISSNICVTLVIDSVVPDIHFGRLEEYTEVVVSNIVKNNNNIVNKPVPNYVKSFSDHSKTEKKLLKFRSILIGNDVDKRSKVFCHPFVVYAFNDLTDDTIESSDTPLLYKMKLATMGNDTTSKSELYVHLEYVSSKNDHFRGRDSCGMKCLFVSKSVRNFFNLNTGTKVVLISEKEKTTRKEIVGILVSPLFPCEDNEALKLEVYNALFHSITNFGNLLLNTKTMFPLDKRKNVILTLRPLDLNCGYVQLKTLKDLSIAINEFNSNDMTEEETSPISSKSLDGLFKPLIQDAILTSTFSLSLNETQRRNIHFFDNFIVTGPSRCGKSTFIEKLLKILMGPPYFLYTEQLDCSKLKGKKIEVVTKTLTDHLNACRIHQPSILFLDNISSLASATKGENEATEMTMHVNRISYKITELVEDFQKDNLILVTACSLSLEAVNPILCSPRGKSLFTTQLDIPELTKGERYFFIKALINSKEKFVNIDDDELNAVALRTDGFLVSDLVKLIDKSFFEKYQRTAVGRGISKITFTDLETSLKTLKPSSLHGINLNEKIPYNFSHVGGLRDAKEKLTEIILWPLLFPDIMKQCPLRLQSAVLIYGAPGSGKTLLANSLAGESKLNFISVKGPELMSKYIGQSEEGVRNIFKKAQQAKPCILFFDEFDSLAPRRGKDEIGVTDRVVNQLLTALDGVEPLVGVSIIAASSRPDLIDPALLRPGRIGTSVMCHFPDEDERLEILKILSANINLAPGVNLTKISKETEGFSGADLRGIFTTAQIKLIDKTVETLFEDSSCNVLSSIFKNKKDVELTEEDILAAIKETKPSLSAKERIKFENIYSEFRNPKTPKMDVQKVTFA
ncbi:peroxisome biosynthesis protein PAS1 isoform X2 [Cimex lectularius]|uniref:Peroxisomal ATPase PEX1 n=1 Tax=Cimex lectularius TaxID=79782 RepID=A0A8I6SLS9_CIMLE|nr:peroxisome biosynthesis protein PAS1 isoform X2 [Cimex lectularius]